MLHLSNKGKYECIYAHMLPFFKNGKKTYTKFLKMKLFTGADGYIGWREWTPDLMIFFFFGRFGYRTV